MSYESALEAAGATLHCFEHFGSYQGEWWAKVTVNGETGWINGSYGSCSGCDSFQSEFGWDDDKKPGYQKRLKEFGGEYLETLITQEEAEASATKHMSWDRIECEEMLEFLKKNRIEK